MLNDKLLKRGAKDQERRYSHSQVYLIVMTDSGTRKQNDLVSKR